MGNSGAMGGGPTYSQHQGSKDTADLNFLGLGPQTSEGGGRSYGPGGMGGGGIGQLNQQNLGGLGSDPMGLDQRRSMGAAV